MRRIDVGRRAELVCAAPCRIAVAQRVVLGEDARLGVAAGVDPELVRVEVAGRGPMAAVRALRRSAIDATVYAPNGDVVLGMNGRYTGSFVGETVFVYQRARIVAGSAPLT